MCWPCMKPSTARPCATCCSKTPSRRAPSSFRTRTAIRIDQRPGGWYGWFTRREFHDDHAAFFASDFTGRQEIFYLIRVVNPGTFQISPARVQPMYQQGVQATSDALQLQVPAPPASGGAQ